MKSVIQLQVCCGLTQYWDYRLHAVRFVFLLASHHNAFHQLLDISVVLFCMFALQTKVYFYLITVAGELK